MSTPIISRSRRDHARSCASGDVSNDVADLSSDYAELTLQNQQLDEEVSTVVAINVF